MTGDRRAWKSALLIGGAVVACSPSAGGRGPDFGAAVGALSAVLRDGASLDGRAVRGVRLDGRCVTVFDTAGEPVRVDWRQRQALPRRRDGKGRDLIGLTDATGRARTLSAATGDQGNDAFSGMVLLAGSCEGAMIGRGGSP